MQDIEYYVLGDINIDLFQIENYNQIRNYANDLLSCSIKCFIGQPTRICRNSKTLIDHIYSNNMSNIMTCGNMYGNISDHLPIFIIALIEQSKSVNNINDTKFIGDISNELTERLNQLNMSDKMSAHEIFDQFINSFLGTVNKHASPKKLVNMKKLRLES